MWSDRCRWVAVAVIALASAPACELEDDGEATDLAVARQDLASPALRLRLLDEAERRLVLPINPGSALMRRIRSWPGYAANSPEFTFVAPDGVARQGQRAEDLVTGNVRYVVAYRIQPSQQWVTAYWDRGAIAGLADPVERGLAQALAAAADGHQVIQFNPGAALQRAMFAEGFRYYPNSPEFDLAMTEGGVTTTYRAQRAERLDDTVVRVYYARLGDWANVGCVSREGVGGRCFARPGHLGPVDPVVISAGNAIHRRVALTFDAGASSAPTAAILEVLRQHSIHATIFLTGAWARANPALVARMVADGHELGNHSDTHPDLTTLAAAAARLELERAAQSIQAIAGRSPTPYFRPPYGAYDGALTGLAAQLGYYNVMWTVDSGDWRPELTAAQVRDRVFAGARDGAIVIHHLGSPQTAAILHEIVDGLFARGLAIVPLSELVE